MSKLERYRKNAEDCVHLAQKTRTASERTMLLHIAETWIRLADEAVQTGAPGTESGALPTLN